MRKQDSIYILVILFLVFLLFRNNSQEKEYNSKIETLRTEYNETQELILQDSIKIVSLNKKINVYKRKYYEATKNYKKAISNYNALSRSDKLRTTKQLLHK